jgi:hypothetical protein
MNLTDACHFDDSGVILFYALPRHKHPECSGDLAGISSGILASRGVAGPPGALPFLSFLIEHRDGSATLTLAL